MEDALQTWKMETVRCYAWLKVYAHDRVAMEANCWQEFVASATCTYAEFLNGQWDTLDAHQLLGDYSWSEAKAFVKGLVR